MFVMHSLRTYGYKMLQKERKKFAGQDESLRVQCPSILNLQIDNSFFLHFVV